MTQSLWITEFEKKIGRRQHIIIYGNIYDQFLWNNSYLNIREFLVNYFTKKKFDLIAYYDQIEKFTLADERAMQDDCNQLALKKKLDNIYHEVEQDFCYLWGLVAQAEKSVATIINLGDILRSHSLDNSKRNPLILLKKCTLEAKIIRQGDLSGYRNTIIMLASDLKVIPEWFYNQNPFVEILQVTLPHLEERRNFAVKFMRPAPGLPGTGFYQGDQIQTTEVNILAEEFADLTIDFSNWDLESLRVTSHQQKIPLAINQVWKLIDFYKFGQREDPWEKLSQERIEKAQSELSQQVIGQAQAVESVISMLILAKIGISLSNSKNIGKPKGIFFFVGPTGVGKTEMAKALTKLVFGDEQAFARFDMSEYKQENADQKLIGSPPGYVGYEEGGRLTNWVLEKPYSIILFDEIEKAHPRILDMFLQILEDGRLTDSKGQTAYFNQTVIIFTSNIGASDLPDPQTGEIIRPGIMQKLSKNKGNNFTYDQVKKHFLTEVKWYFTTKIGRAELLGRLGDNIVVFDFLRSQYVTEIAKKLLKILATVAQDKYQLTIDFLPSVYDAFQQEMQKDDNLLLGGRNIKAVLESLIERPLNYWIFKNYPQLDKLAGKHFQIGIDPQGKLIVDDISVKI